jgi:hypothetical protein
VHNHPSGDPTPSHADIEMTKAIVEVAKPFGIAVHDHLIVGKDGHAGPEGAEVDLKHAGSLPSRTIAPGSPWQNGFAERLIGSIRRECVDHIVVLGEAHLRRILTKYATYYNELRTHRSLGKDAPIHRAIQLVGRIAAVPVLGGLHHHYCRI